jgi:hypothetical protein
MNSKLKLNLDDLTVDSFHTAAGDKATGTVFGEQQCTCLTQCGQNTCPGCPTCDATCNGSCAATCAGTCANTCDDYTCGASCNTCNFACQSCMGTGCYPYECCA